jgi:hypothetical protein
MAQSCAVNRLRIQTAPLAVKSHTNAPAVVFKPIPLPSVCAPRAPCDSALLKTHAALHPGRNRALRIGHFQPHAKGAAGRVDHAVDDRSRGLVAAGQWRLGLDGDAWRRACTLPYIDTGRIDLHAQRVRLCHAARWRVRLRRSARSRRHLLQPLGDDAVEGAAHAAPLLEQLADALLLDLSPGAGCPLAACRLASACCISCQ